MLPRLVFVLGKGGVGRSTVATGLGLGLARAGERVLIAQWAVGDAISAWFDRPPVGFEAGPIAPRLWTMNFSIEPSLEEYFVEHLHLGAFYRAVVSSRQVRLLTRAAPGLDALMFAGRLMALTELKEEAIGRSFDRVIVDAPAMGHGTSILRVPSVARTLGLGGLFARECERVAAVLADARKTAVVVVTTPEELAIEETLEFWPRITAELRRPPLTAVINRSARRLGGAGAARAWIAGSGESAIARDALRRVSTHLDRRDRRERELRAKLAGATLLPLVAIDDALLLDGPEPRRIVSDAAGALSALWATP